MAKTSRSSGSYGRWYEVSDNRRYPSVTTILGVIAKPALVKWAANTERELVMDVAAQVYESLAGKVISKPSFEAAVNGRLGAARSHQIQMAHAASIGSLVHARIEWEMRTQLGLKGLKEPTVPEQEVGADGQVTEHPAHVAYQAYRKWREAHDVRPVAVEQIVWSHKYGYAGTVDWVGYVADQLTLADWKTAAGVYDEMRLQVAAYRQAWIEMGHGVPPLGGYLLRLPKTPNDTFEPHVIPWSEQDELFVVFRAARHLFVWQQEQYAKWKERQA